MEKNTKICEVCGRELPLSDFSKSYKNRCRECVAAKVRSERHDGKKSTDNIDWEQRRYEIAKEMLSAIYIDDGYAQRADKSRQFEYKTPDGTAREAVRFADALIAELKKGGHNG